jgi:putative FmdB family regulatory protein
MPIYEYRCDDCGFQKEHLQKLADAPITDCPTCGKASYRKLVSAAGFQLKGSGWYATDFKGTKSQAKPEAEAPPKCSGSTCSAGASTACST